MAPLHPFAQMKHGCGGWGTLKRSHSEGAGITLDNADFTDAQAIASITRITDGNFRLLHRLFVQIERILKINGLTVITDDVVEATRSTLVVGVT